jgi:hypothetical protein
VCHLKRSKRNKLFKEIAAHGRASVGWFFGLKAHVVINQLGELMAALAAYTIAPLNLSAFKLLEKHQSVIAYQS